MEWILYLFCLLLVLIGIVGSVVPLIPGVSLILAAGILHKVFLSAEFSWWTVILLILGNALSIGLDYLSGALGSRVFGATKWAFIGAFGGGVVGLFFGIPGLLLGPLIGAFVFEWALSKRGISAAAGAMAGVGLGVVGNFFIQFGIALMMAVLYLGDAFFY
ncbi:MAG: DUF456 domain-containing protein [Verrucomicrobiota bacterium]